MMRMWLGINPSEGNKPMDYAWEVFCYGMALDDIRVLLREGRKIAAMKRLREEIDRHGSSFALAKVVVTFLAEREKDIDRLEAAVIHYEKLLDQYRMDLDAANRAIAARMRHDLNTGGKNESPLGG